MALFTPEERRAATERLLELLRADERILETRLAGSGAKGFADRWSDVDIVLTVAQGVDHDEVAGAWVRRLYDELPVVHHFEVAFGERLVRGFLLESFLEIDLEFAPASTSSADGPRPLHEWHAGPAWHDVLHVATALRRGRLWQARFYVDRLRERTIELAAARHGLYPDLADRLPADVLGPLERTLVPLRPDALWEAGRVVTRAFFAELRQVAPDLAGRLEEPLLEFLRLAEAEPG